MNDFFKPGFEYDDATVYTAPELIRTFRCVSVDTLPGTDALVAFGFMRSESYGWGGTGMGPEHWAKGWNLTGSWRTQANEAAGVPTEAWYYTDDDMSSAEVYLDVEAAKAAAIADMEALDPGLVTGEEVYTWRTVEKLPGCFLLDEDGRYTGWSVNRMRVAAPSAKAAV